MTMVVVEDLDNFLKIIKKNAGSDRISIPSRKRNSSSTAPISLKFFSEREFFRGGDEENSLEMRTLESGKVVYTYTIFFLLVKPTKYLIGCRYSGALKLFFLTLVESVLQATYLKPDLLKLKEDFTLGANLKGHLSISGVRLDYFGETGSPIEKLFIRGKNVFDSKKLDNIVAILVEDLRDKAAGISWHSIAMVYTKRPTTQRIAVDKFGNMRGTIDTSLSETEALVAMCDYLERHSSVAAVCPLRREDELLAEPT